MSLRAIIIPLILLFGLISPPSQAAVTSFAIVGDAGKFTTNTKTALESISRSGIKKLILPGDNLYEGTYEDQWAAWKEFDFSVVAIGNHTAGYAKETKFFQMPGEYYFKIINGVRYLILNSDNKLNYGEQTAWLEKQLAADYDGPTFLVWHHPTYTVSSYHPWDERADFQTRVRRLLKKYRDHITALLVGHDHMGASYCLDSLPMIVSGAIWDTRSPTMQAYRDRDGTLVSPKWLYPNGTIVWGRLDVDPGKGTSQISFIRASDDKVLYTAELQGPEGKHLCKF